MGLQLLTELPINNRDKQHSSSTRTSILLDITDPKNMRKMGCEHVPCYIRLGCFKPMQQYRWIKEQK